MKILLILLCFVNFMQRIRTERFLWRMSSWTPCSKTCDQGVSTAKFQCFDVAEEKFVSSKHCKHISKIHHQKVCINQTPCNLSTTPPPPQGYWYKSQFGGCSATCGRAVKSRLVACISFTGYDVLDDSKCKTDERPTDYELCENDECPVNAEWTIGSWSKCSEQCEGFETRKVLCRRDDDGRQADDKHCEKKRPKPPSSRACGGPCSRWVDGKWGKCRYNRHYKKCNEAKQTRCVLCVDKRTLKESNECLPSDKPVTRRSCKHGSCNGA